MLLAAQYAEPTENGGVYKVMKKLNIEVPEYSDSDGIKYNWIGDFTIKYWCPLNFKRHDKTLRNASKHVVADSFFKTKPPLIK